MLRDLDLNRQNCNLRADNQNVNKIPLTNEHGDVFLRHNDQYIDDCGPISGEGGYEDFPPNQQYYSNQRPLPVESDYFYDQYIDYPINETSSNVVNQTLGRFNNTSPYVDFNQNKFNQNQIPPPVHAPPASQFTFFGHPLPSLTLGNVWGTGRTANNRAASGETTRGKGRVQIFRAGDPELEVIVNQPNNLDQDNKNREPAASVKKPIIDSLENMDEKFYRPASNAHFQTPFLQPKPEKGFSPMIPGIKIGGFVPIHDPSKNDSKETFQSNDWPKDDNFKEIQLVTKMESQTKRTLTKSTSIGLIDKIGSTTVSHLTTSLSPILSTLVPKIEVMTEKTRIENPMDEDGEEDEDSREIYLRNANKIDKMLFEEELFKQNLEITQETPTSGPSTTEETMQIKFGNTGFFSSSLPPVLSTESTSIESLDEADKSSELSADHLIAPGSIISQDITSKTSSLPVKAGKITKVFSPPPSVSNSNEISKLLSPFYPQQFSSEPPTNFDNEYQPNQIYTQTYNNHERISEEPYERNDMEW